MISEEKRRDNKENNNNNNGASSWPNRNGPSPYQEKEEGVSVWGILLFGLIGATATTFLLTRLQSSLKGAINGSNRSSFKEGAWKRYNQRMQEEHEEEMERVERIRRMQSVFNRERSKHKRNYESWRESGPGVYHQHFQRDDWYWKTETSYKNQNTTNSRATPRESGSYMLSHHYSVLGLDRWRTKPYTEAEIKTAFRDRAKEYHPDQNQDNKVAAEAKFKEVLMSYEAIKLERKNGKS